MESKDGFQRQLSVPIVLTFKQLDRLASSMKRDDPTKRWTDDERRKLARLRLMLVLKDYVDILG